MHHILNHKQPKIPESLINQGFQKVQHERKVFKMFGKKKESGLAVQHYEGIEQFAKDYPCRLELNEDMLTITRIKPETTVTLPRNRIQSINAMEESQFMQKYH